MGVIRGHGRAASPSEVAENCRRIAEAMARVAREIPSAVVIAVHGGPRPGLAIVVEHADYLAYHGRISLLTGEVDLLHAPWRDDAA